MLISRTEEAKKAITAGSIVNKRPISEKILQSLDSGIAKEGGETATGGRAAEAAAPGTDPKQAEEKQNGSNNNSEENKKQVLNVLF